MKKTKPNKQTSKKYKWLIIARPSEHTICGAHRSILCRGKTDRKAPQSRETRAEFRSSKLSQVGGERNTAQVGDEGEQTREHALEFGPDPRDYELLKNS